MTVDQTKWDARFLHMAEHEVAQWSKDPNAKVGCVIVSPYRHHITIGYNGLPRGIHDTATRLRDRVLKNRLSVHAELNAILNSRTDLVGWTLYVTKAPCVDCALAMIQVGIARIVCPNIDPLSTWAGSQREAHNLLMEAGVGGTDV